MVPRTTLPAISWYRLNDISRSRGGPPAPDCWLVAGCETMASILSTSGLGQATFHGPQSSRAGGQAASGNPEDLNRLMSSAVKRLSSKDPYFWCHKVCHKVFDTVLIVTVSKVCDTLCDTRNMDPKLTTEQNLQLARKRINNSILQLVLMYTTS